MKKVLQLGGLILLMGSGLLLQAEVGAPAPAHSAAAIAVAPTFTSAVPFTPTFSLTFTPTRTPTNSPTGTITLVAISTHSFTPSLTPTTTPSNSPTPSATFTSTPGVFQFTVSPKPDAQGQIHFQWGTTIPADEAYLRVFTSGFRLVWEESFNKNEKPEFLTTDQHDVTWNGRDDQARPMPPGFYICFISVTVGKKTYESSGKTEIP